MFLQQVADEIKFRHPELAAERSSLTESCIGLSDQNGVPAFLHSIRVSWRRCRFLDWLIPLGMKPGSSSPYATLSRAIRSSLLSRTFTKVTVMQSVRPRPSVQLFDPLSWDPSLVMLGLGTMAITPLHVVLAVILWVPSCGLFPHGPSPPKSFWMDQEG